MDLIQISTRVPPTSSHNLWARNTSSAPPWRPHLHQPRSFITSARCQMLIQESDACTHPGSSRNRQGKENRPTFSKNHGISFLLERRVVIWGVQHTAPVQKGDRGQTHFFLPVLPVAPTRSLSPVSPEITEMPAGVTPLIYISCLIPAFDATNCVVCFKHSWNKNQGWSLYPFFLNRNLLFFFWIKQWLLFTKALANTAVNPKTLCRKNTDFKQHEGITCLCAHTWKVNLHFTSYGLQFKLKLENKDF